MTRDGSPTSGPRPPIPDVGALTTPFTRLIAATARIVLSSVARVRVEVAVDLPRSGPLIVVANHLSNADPPLVGGWLMPVLGRRMRFLAKAELFVGPIGRLLESQGVIPVRRGGSDIEAYRLAREVLERGEAICIFPEGTRSRDGTLGAAKPGVAMLATRSGVPILPVGISGTDRFIAPGAHVPRIGARITVRVGRPFTLERVSGADRRAGLSAASDLIMRRIAALVDERHRGRYAPSLSAAELDLPFLAAEEPLDVVGVEEPDERRGGHGIGDVRAGKVGHDREAGQGRPAGGGGAQRRER
jgi:1-acyl-sn-glycerol-3-phosphate acyltransferase